MAIKVLPQAFMADPERRSRFESEARLLAALNHPNVGAIYGVEDAEGVAESLTATGFPSHKRHSSPNIHFYQQMTLRSHGVRRAGSAALDLAYVACGRLDGFWEFNLNPWDTSSGVLLVQEAGGTITHFDGSPFTLDSREVLATNGRICQRTP